MLCLCLCYSVCSGDSALPNETRMINGNVKVNTENYLYLNH